MAESFKWINWEISAKWCTEWPYTFFCLQILYENYYFEHLLKVSTCVKYLIDAYHGYIFPRNLSLLFFGNLDSWDYHRDSLNVMFPRSPNCFLFFSLVFPHNSPGVSTVSSGVSLVSPQCPPPLPASYFKFFIYIIMIYILHTKRTKINK